MRWPRSWVMILFTDNTEKFVMLAGDGDDEVRLSCVMPMPPKLKNIFPFFDNFFCSCGMNTHAILKYLCTFFI